MGKVKNLKRLKRRINAIPKEIRKEVMRTHRLNGEEITALQRQWVPEKSGHLRGEIYFELEHKLLRLRVIAGTFYASFLEFGTRHMSAVPFFYPAYRALRKRMKSRMTRNTNKAIKRAIAKK